jgi:hypothetical protein
VTLTAIKHANKNFLSRLGGFSLQFSLGVEGWLWIGWVVDFSWFECFLFFMVAGARKKLRSTLLTLILTSLKPNTQFECFLFLMVDGARKKAFDHQSLRSNKL